MRKDEYHAPLPDPSAYLARLGYDEDATEKILSRQHLKGTKEEQLALLNDLIDRHQTHIPFENLDICLYHRLISLYIDDLFEKIVTQHRGGYCFELNGLFVQLLEELGFCVRSVLCRIVRGMQTIRPCLHRAIVVSLPDSLWFVDVGFGGPMPAGAAIIRDGARQEISGEWFCIDRADEYWWTLSRFPKEELLQFTLQPQSRAEFLPANAWCSSDQSVFSRTPMVNLRTPTGSLSLTGETLTIRSGESKTLLPVVGEAQLRDVLMQYFSILLPEFL